MLVYFINIYNLHLMFVYIFYFFVFFYKDILLFFNNSLQCGKIYIQIGVFQFTFFKTFFIEYQYINVKIY